jgi:GNAT superfamily N-acetyltransferase
VARDDNDIVALLDFARDGDSVEIGLFIAAEHRRRGLGRTLLEAVPLAAPDTAVLVAYCAADNYPALAFLRATGFHADRWVGGTTRWWRDAIILAQGRG